MVEAATSIPPGTNIGLSSLVSTNACSGLSQNRSVSASYSA